MLRFKEYIKEGGGAVGDVVRINQENVEATLKAISTKIIKPLKITNKDIGVLGSTGKRKPGGSSGDIDIAIDLCGFTNFNRAGIFSHRAAPLQVNFLGYPGTMGSKFIYFSSTSQWNQLTPQESIRNAYGFKRSFL